MAKRRRNISRQSVLREQEDNITVWMNGVFNMSLHGSITVVIFRACFKFQRSIKFLEVLHYGEKNILANIVWLFKIIDTKNEVSMKFLNSRFQFRYNKILQLG